MTNINQTTAFAEEPANTELSVLTQVADLSITLDRYYYLNYSIVAY